MQVGFSSIDPAQLKPICCSIPFMQDNGKRLLTIGACPEAQMLVCVSIQDFMGFLHIGWDLAIAEDLDEQTLTGLSPAWEAASKVC